MSATMMNSKLAAAQLKLADFINAPVIQAEEELPNLEVLDDLDWVTTRLNNIDWAFTESKTGYLSHDIHPYPAKFIPQIPRNLIKLLSLRGERVWDPFGGSGTTALEAILMGRCALSTDVNPIAKVIGEAKTLTLTKEQDDLLSDFIEQLSLLAKNSAGLEGELTAHQEDYSLFIPPVPNLTDWFHPNAVRELAYLRWRIDSLVFPQAATLAITAFSKSILRASYQDEETRYARKPREVKIGFVIQLYANNLSGALSKVRQLGPLLRFREAEFRTIDLRVATVKKKDNDSTALAKNSVDLVVTSPPYPNTTDYHLYHRFRLFWLDYDPRDLAHKEIGSHLRHQKEGSGFDDYLKEMSLCLSRIMEVLRPGRYAVLVVGDGVFGGQVYSSVDHIKQTAQELGFEAVTIIDRHLHTTKRSFITAARRLKTESLLVLRKPNREVKLSLIGPPYKLWPYEDILRKREVEALIGPASIQRKARNLEIAASALAIDKVRRLTFTHGFLASEISRECTWQAVLENGDTAIEKAQKKDPKYATHGIHAYKGKFYPQLAKSLFNLAQLEPEQTVLDPFCGSGTVLLESYLNGLRGFGTDINILAVKIARVKTEILDVDPYLRDRTLSLFQDRLEHCDASESWISKFSESSHAELLSWFPRAVLGKLGWLFYQIEQVSEPCVREFLEVIVSSIVRDISQQDPKDLRIRRREKPIEDAPVFEIFKRRLAELRGRLLHFSERVNSSPHLLIPARAVEGDCRDAHVFQRNQVTPGSINAVVTSPPYATALPYIDTDRLSLLLLFGLNSKERSVLESVLIGSREISKKKKDSYDALIDGEDFSGIYSDTAKFIIKEVRQRNVKSETGFRRQNMASLLYLYFRDMSLAMNNVSHLLRDGASAFFVIGDTRTTAGDKEIHITSGKALQEIGTSLGWSVEDIIPITVTTENRLHSKNSITKNEIIWFRK
jgi:tRNA G10  N-methylase Trm11